MKREAIKCTVRTFSSTQVALNLVELCSENKKTSHKRLVFNVPGTGIDLTAFSGFGRVPPGRNPTLITKAYHSVVDILQTAREISFLSAVKQWPESEA